MMAGGFETNNKNIAIGVVALVVIVAVAGVAYWMMNDGDQADATYTVSLSYDSETGTATGEGVYDAGEKVTVTATPANGYGFKGWFVGTEMVSEDERYTFTADSDMVLTPSFRMLLSISVEYDSRYGDVTGTGLYMEGDMCTLTATPKEGYVFAGWFPSWDTSDGYNPFWEERSYTFVVTYSVTYVAEFGGRVSFVASADSPEKGSVTPSGGYMYYMEDVSIDAKASEGYVFDHWIINGERSDYMYSSITITLTGYTEVVAVFSVEQCDVDIEYDSSMGSLIGVNSGVFEYGEDFHIQAIAKPGYSFDHWEINGQSYLSSEMTYTIRGDTTIRAVFVMN